MRSRGANVLRLVALDMDGTLVDVPSSWAMVHAHFGDANPEGLRRFMAYEIDDLEFIRSDVRIWWRHRPDLSLGEIGRILDRAPLMPGASELIRGLRARGARTAIVSGGIDLLARRIADELGIDVVLANGFRVDAAGRLTGEGIVRVPIHRKADVLADLQARLGVDPSETASVGNSEIDVGLFRRSRIGVAFRPEDDAVRHGASAIVEDGSLERVLDVLSAFPSDPAPPSA
ncbi:MAG TPA: HAD-IB family phosphatase [Thermoplasmata archaeon]|nr:HAD-IB family phosphatase [Thermoplasmata archaeon]